MPTRNIDDTDLQRRIDALMAKPIQSNAVSVEQRWVVTKHSEVVCVCQSEQEAERVAREMMKPAQEEE